jgi:type 1 glutamine amidotransferase
MNRSTLTALPCLLLLTGNPLPAAEPGSNIQSVLQATTGKAGLSKPRVVTLQWSRNDHPPNTHGYQYFAKKWKGLLDQVDGLSCILVEGFPDAEQWAKSDLVVVYLTQKFLDEKKFAIMDTFIKRGGDLMVLHQGMVQRKQCQAWAERIGIAYQFVEPKRSKWGPHEAPVTLDTGHAIFKGFPGKIQYKDELYWDLIRGTRGTIKVIGHTRAPRQAEDDPTTSPVFWTVEDGTGDTQSRVFGCVIGHWDAIFDDPYFRTALLRGTAWSMGESLEPFEALAER